MASVLAYIGTRLRRQSRRRLAVLSLATLAALAVSGCSLSLSGFMATEEEISTGSIELAPPGAALSRELTAEDWRRAGAALGVALDPQGNGQSASWDNPETGLKGQFTPVGAPFVRNDEICRGFLATLVSAAGLKWMQGSACKPSGAEWSLREVRPWRKPA